MEKGGTVSNDGSEAPKTASEKKAALENIAKKLNRAERTTGRSGAVPMSSKERMLDMEKLKALHPDKHFRRVNTTDPGKVATRLDSGYKKTSDADIEAAGVKGQVGETVIMEIPREVYEERVEQVKDLGRRRLKAHKAEVRETMEAVVRELKAQGIDVPLERLMVDE